MYQHQIQDHNAQLEIIVRPEVRSYWLLRYRACDPRFSHRADWITVEHLTPEELEDVHAAVLAGFMNDLEAQGLF